jgi:hypothetical protein
MQLGADEGVDVLKLLTMLGRNRLALALLLFAGVTCRESTGPRYQSASIGIAPVLTERAAAIYSNLVVGGLLVDNVHIVLKHADGTVAIDTVINVAADQDSVVLEMPVTISGSQETLTATVELRDGTLVLFAGEMPVHAVAGAAGTTPSVEIPLTFEGPGAEVASIDIAPADTAITPADSVVYRPSAKDQNQAAVTDFGLNWSVKNPLLGTVSIDGVFKPLGIRGSTYVIAETYTDVIDSARVVITPPAMKLVVISGNNQTGTVGGQLPQDLVIESQAADNLPVPGVTVTLLGPPGTVVIQITDKTDANGRISLSVPVGTIAGAIAFTVSSPGLATLNLTGTAVAGAPAKLAMNQQPSATALAGVALTTQPRVQLQDTYGNSAAVAGKAVVASLTTPAGRTLAGTTSVNTDANGVATFTNLAVIGLSGSLTLRFTHDTLTAATSSAITLGVGEAAKVVLTTRPPATTTSGATLLTQPIARITDAAGNTVTSSAAAVTVTASAGYTVGGSATVTAGAGIVTYTGLSVTGPAGNALLTFASSGLASDTATVAVTVSAGAPASIAAVSPTAFIDSIQANVASGNLAAVVVKDAQNIPVPGILVKFRLHGGVNAQLNGVIDTIAVAETGPDGIAKLTSQRLADVIGVDSMFVTTSGVTDTVKIVAGVFNGAPHHLAILGQPDDTDAGQPISVVVVLQDRLNNFASVLTGSPPNVTLEIRSGFGETGAVLSPAPSALTQPATGGIVSFFVSIDLPGTDYGLTASASGFTSVHTQDFQIFEPTPDAVTWVNPAGGNWSVASNWSTGVVPGAGDVVNIDLDGTYTVTLDVNVNVKALCIGANSGTQTVVASSKSITITDVSNVYANGVLSLTNSTITGAGGSYLNSGTILAHGSSVIDVVFENAGLLRVQGQASGGNANLTFPNGFTNSYDLELTSSGGAYSATLTVTSGTLTNAGDISSIVGAGGGRLIAAQVDNQGTMTSVQTLNVTKADADHLNSGTINVTGGDFTFNLSGSTPTFTNTGNVSITASRSFTIAGGEANFGAGTVSGPVNSYVLISNSTLTFSTFTILVPIQLSGTSPISGGAVTVASGQTLRLYGGTLSASLDVQAGGTMEWISNGTISGALTNDGTIKVRGQAFGTNASLTVTNGFTNNGTIELTSINGAYSSTLTVTNGTLVNSATGTIYSLSGVGGSRTLNAQLHNQGLLHVSTALTINKASAAHVNDGTINLNAANLTITQSGTTPSFTNTGSVGLGANRTFSISGGTVTTTVGTVTGLNNSTFAVSSATLDFAVANVPIPMTLIGTTIGAGSVTVANGQALTLLSGAVTEPITVQDGGTLRTLGTASLTTIVMDVNSVLQVRGQQFGGNATLTIANGFTSFGTIELTSQDGAYNSTLNVASGTLTNDVQGFIRSMVGAGGSRTLGAALDNQGSLDVVQALTLAKTSAAHLNSGAIYQNSANLTVTQSGGGASFTNSGAISLSAGRTFTLSGGTVDFSAGTVSGTVTSTLEVSSATLAFSTATVTIPMTLNSTSISGGSVTIPSGQTLTLLGGGLNDPVTIQGGGTLLTHGAVALNGAVTLSAGGTLRPRGQQDGGNSTLTVANGFTNSGTIQLTTADGAYNSTLNVTTGTLANAAGATIHSAAGAGGGRTLGAQLDNAGTLDVDQNLTLSKASAAHVNSGAVDVTVADFTLTQSGDAPTFTNTGTVTLANSRTWTVNGSGTLDLSAGTVSGTVLSSLTVSGHTLAFSTTTVTIPLTLTTTTIAGGSVTIPTGQTLTLLGGGLSDPVTIANGGTLLTHGSVSLTGALSLPTGGTLRVRGQQNGANATLTIASGFSNNGLIQLTSVDGAYNSTLNVTSGELLNASGATIHAAGGAGGARIIGAQLNNVGTLDVDQDLTLTKLEADHVNSGAIDLTVADLTLSQSGTTPSFTNTGTVTLANGRTWTVNAGGTLDLSAGTVSGTVLSRLLVNGTTLAFTPNTVTIPLTLTSTVLQGGSLTIGTSQTVTLFGGGLSDPVTINSGGTLLTLGTVTLAGTLTQNGNLRVRGQQNGNNAYLTVADGFTNNGLIELTAADGAYNSTFAVTNGTLTNNFGGMIHSDASTGGGRTLAAKLSNNGTLDVDHPLTLDKPDANHYNANSIDLTNASMTVTQTGTTPSFGNGILGVITLGTSKTLFITGGTANFIGSSVVQGQPTSVLQMTGGTLNFTPAHVTVPLQLLSSTAISSGTVTIANGQTVTLLGGSLLASVTIQSGGLLRALAASAVTSVTVEPGGELQVLGDNRGSNATLTVANGFANEGTIRLSSETTGYTSALAVTSGTLTNTGGGTIVSEFGAGGARTIAAQLDNQGTIDIEQTLTLNKASALHTNTGVITLTSPGTLTVTQSGTSPTFTNNGGINLGTRTMTVTGGGVFTNASGAQTGTIQGPGTLVVSGTTYTNNGIMDPGLGVLNVTGSYNQSGQARFDMASNVANTGYGKIAVSGTVNLSGELKVTLNDYLPAVGHTFTIMTFGSKSGTFSTTNLPDLTSSLRTWQVTVNPANVVLTIIPYP